MKILYMGLKDIHIMLMDKKTVMLIILFPILLIFVLGMSLDSVFRKSTVTINKFDIAICNKDGKKYSEKFKDFLKSKDVSKVIKVREMNENTALNKIKSGKIPVLILIPEGYSDDIESGNTPDIKIYFDKGSEFEAKTVESFVKSYTGAVLSGQAAVKASNTELKKIGINGQNILKKLSLNSEDDNFKISSSSVISSDNISSMQYYSAAMLAMFALFAGSLGTVSILEERESGTLLKLFSTEISKWEILCGKFLGTFLVGIFDAFILISFTSLIFKVDWGNSVSGLLILSFSMVFASCGFAYFLPIFLKTSKSVSISSMVIIMIMSFIGGNMYPISQMSSSIQSASKFFINNWALIGYLRLMHGGNFSSVLYHSVILCAFGIAFLSAGIFNFKMHGGRR